MTDRVRALDGLRALCVLGVMLNGFRWLLPFGWVGVLIFYVLSGYLITAILRDERAFAVSAGSFFTRFYFRRSARIFPPYFLYLGIVELAHQFAATTPSWPTVRPYAFLYAVNIGMAQGVVDIGPTHGHLWTLSVEEQFYLVWPLVVWFMPPRRLPLLAALLFVSGPIVRIISTTVFGLNVGQLYVSSFSHLDAFAIGALFAVSPPRWPRIWPRAFAALAVTLAIGVVIVATNRPLALRTLGFPEGLHFAFAYYWGATLLNLTAALFIVAAARGELRALGHPVLTYVGKISYGVYLAQKPVMAVYDSVLHASLLARVHSTAVVTAIGFMICLGISLAIAALSYHIFERPILRIRDRLIPPRASAALS